MTTAITNLAQEMVAAAKAGTTTYGEALNKLGYLSTRSQVTPTPSHVVFNAAYTLLLNEMKSLAHGVDPAKPYD